MCAMAGAKGLKLLVLAQAVAWAAAFKQLGNLKMPNLGNVAKDMEAKAKFGAPAAPNVTRVRRSLIRPPPAPHPLHDAC